MLACTTGLELLLASGACEVKIFCARCVQPASHGCSLYSVLSAGAGTMPEKKTVERAREDARQGKAPSTQAGEFVREEIHHVREGKHGVRSPRQAIAIGLSKARKAGVKLAPPPAGTPSAKKERSSGRRKSSAKTSRKRSQATSRALKREGRSGASRGALSRQARTSAARRRKSRRS
jgi:hypothetical protein